jgi:CubicO group peptidase (beta-lactamase class C family)
MPRQNLRSTPSRDEHDVERHCSCSVCETVRMSKRTGRRRFLKTGVALLGLPVLSGCRTPRDEPPTPRVPATLIAWLEAELPRLMKVSRVPGLAIALVAEGRVAWARGFGVKSSTSGVTVDQNTVFEAGSVSKTVFAYAVLKLVEKDVLALDTPLTRYVSDDRWIEGDPRLDQITARHILSHTSGFQNWRSDKEPLRIQFTPGERWEYSGEGYSYLQRVVSGLTGGVDAAHCETMWDRLKVCATQFDHYLRRNLLEPFEMSASGLIPSPGVSDRVASGHREDGTPTGRPPGTPITAARYGAAGGLFTSVVDYARFLGEVLDPEPQDDFRLGRAMREEMLRPQVKVTNDSSWALGWQILHQPTGDLISHSGDNPGFKAFTLASVPRKAGYVFMMNGDNAGEIFKALAYGDTPLNGFVTA